jgi:formamidopyrimidine-DNA glycosylase
MISVYSLDGNSIFEVAKRFERLGIEQLAKTPLETSERIKSGQDTGSSKWLSDFNNLYGLANQLKVKTSLQQTDTPIIKQQLEAEYIQFNLDNRSEKTDAEDELKTAIAGKNLTESRTIFEARVDFINTIPELMDRRFLMEIALEVWSQRFSGARTGVAYKQQLQDMLEFIVNQQLALKIGSADVSQQKLLYSTLNKVDSSIANLIQQLTPLTEALYNTLKSKLTAWTSEINDNLQDALKDDARTIRQSFSEASASTEIGNYKEVFERVNKKYTELYTLIQTMGASASDRASISLNPNMP